MSKILISVLILFLGYPIFSQDFHHFRVFADIRKEHFFKEILKETMLDDVFIDKYQFVVSSKPEREAFIVIGRFDSKDVEWDETAYRYDWAFLSKPLRDKILSYKNKIIIR